jgi:hypothetical protein
MEPTCMQFFDLLLRHGPELRASSPPKLPPASIPLSLSSRRKRGRRTGGGRVVRQSVRPSVRPTEGRWFTGTIEQVLWFGCQPTVGRESVVTDCWSSVGFPKGISDNTCSLVREWRERVSARDKRIPAHSGELYNVSMDMWIPDDINPGTSEWLCFYTRSPCSDKILFIIINNY